MCVCVPEIRGIFYFFFFSFFPVISLNYRKNDESSFLDAKLQETKSKRPFAASYLAAFILLNTAPRATQTIANQEGTITMSQKHLLFIWRQTWAWLNEGYSEGQAEKSERGKQRGKIKKEKEKACSGFRLSCRKESKHILKLFVQVEGSRAFLRAVIQVCHYSQLSSKRKKLQGWVAMNMKKKKMDFYCFFTLCFVFMKDGRSSPPKSLLSQEVIWAGNRYL